jgi:alanine racemase
VPVIAVTNAPTRPSHLRIDLAAIAANVRLLREHIPEETRLAAVVKADGYGHGAIAVAKTALASGAASLCVATVPEGIELRAAGIQSPILILGPSAPAEIAALVADDLTPAAMDVAFCAAVADAADRAGKAPYPVHIKADTGMHRYGVPAAEAPSLLQSLRAIRGIAVEGVFTHFATADVVGDPFLREQAEQFVALIEVLERAGLRPPIVHAANSGAILQRVAPWDMVRAGIALYGLPPAPDFPAPGLTPAMSVHTAITRVFTVPAGGSIGYGRRYVAAAPARAALLPLGYADGLSRALSDRGHVLIGGWRCRLAGVVSMDQCVTLLPDGLDARVGDPVVVVGAQGDARQSLTDLALAADTINYEIAVRFGARMERMYLNVGRTSAEIASPA